MSDGRGALLACPACRGPMSQLVLPPEVGASVEVCQVCRGVWFDWFDGETSQLAQHLDAQGVGVRHSASGRPCPRDGDALEEHPYLDAGPRVFRCPSCLGLFAPREQIGELQRFHARMPEQHAGPIEHASLLARLWHAFVG